MDQSDDVDVHVFFLFWVRMGVLVVGKMLIKNETTENEQDVQM